MIGVSSIVHAITFDGPSFRSRRVAPGLSIRALDIIEIQDFAHGVRDDHAHIELIENGEQRDGTGVDIREQIVNCS